jgi:hypothetical protein
MERAKDPKEKYAPHVCTVGINGVAYHFDKLSHKLTELLINVNKLPVVFNFAFHLN